VEASKRYPSLSVVIPVYNERATVEELLRRVSAVPLVTEIIIVDDASTDGTREVLRRLATDSGAGSNGGATASPSAPPLAHSKMRILFHDRNRGKGAALRTGFNVAQGEVILVQDADLEYDPQDYFTLLDPIQQGVADVVYGSRFHGGPHRVLYFWHFAANRFLGLLSSIFTNLNLSDVWSCYKVFPRRVLERIRLQEDRFGFDVEITAKLAKVGCRVYEVPISYYGRTYEEGKKITWKDGVKSVWQILKYNLFFRPGP
jgi:glycosyltransferase involved in cell wall biosynthesis